LLLYTTLFNPRLWQFITQWLVRVYGQSSQNTPHHFPIYSSYLTLSCVLHPSIKIFAAIFHLKRRLCPQHGDLPYPGVNWCTYYGNFMYRS
jgi:uncharacterized membrane protein YhdT